mmetsp:Transcript_53151/g.154696  ORF Transcript_53151/g.154696 Transcript_53151/m.154696 type:complete len:218 (-) Transcript_53151:218-871(-)
MGKILNLRSASRGNLCCDVWPARRGVCSQAYELLRAGVRLLRPALPCGRPRLHGCSQRGGGCRLPPPERPTRALAPAHLGARGPWARRPAAAAAFQFGHAPRGACAGRTGALSSFDSSGGSTASRVCQPRAAGRTSRLRRVLAVRRHVLQLCEQQVRAPTTLGALRARTAEVCLALPTHGRRRRRLRRGRRGQGALRPLWPGRQHPGAGLAPRGPGS